MQYDSLIDWTEFYRERLPHGIAGKNGVNRSARCPIHDGRDDNFSFSVVDGRWHCFSHCGGGQARDLLVALGEASDVREADIILDVYAGKAGGGGKASTAGKADKPQREAETLETFARAKRFGVDWLREFGLRDGMAYNTPCVEFPFMT